MVEEVVLNIRSKIRYSEFQYDDETMFRRGDELRGRILETIPSSGLLGMRKEIERLEYLVSATGDV